MRNRIRKITICIIIIFLIFIVIHIVIKNDIYISEDTLERDKIEHIALVYRNENYTYEEIDYLYIIDENGDVYYEDLIVNRECYNEDFTTTVTSVYENEEKKKYVLQEYTDSFKDLLYNTNYNWTVFNYQLGGLDSSKCTYYALIREEGEYVLVELKRIYSENKVSWNSDYNKICEYIDKIRKEIRERE